VFSKKTIRGILSSKHEVRDAPRVFPQSRQLEFQEAGLCLVRKRFAAFCHRSTKCEMRRVFSTKHRPADELLKLSQLYGDVRRHLHVRIHQLLIREQALISSCLVKLRKDERRHFLAPYSLFESF
jgi:hypothetical protein